TRKLLHLMVFLQRTNMFRGTEAEETCAEQGESGPGRGPQVQPVQAPPPAAQLGAGASGRPAALPRGRRLQPGQAVHPQAQRQLPAHQELLLQ
ncbi:unnamed protein product, partial [Tetraodon nigroviridis]